ncbi:lanthionine synthetase LanC family protein [Streptomyces zagrosensis]|uniref:Lanthionine synthetase n=1 Tax=Streptomyces zagrosensis TaxID=1042984 RepID=A0A7W9QCG0_9ACTN|nr:lanthionine synthetase LanC family protein [Streptomyces zagrosensis]MBB5937228.1 hypothetical protein [Streptomyces zagrosensis]
MTTTDLRARAAQRALEIARDLRDPETITAALTPRAAHTLCYGLAGTALLHACLAEAEPGSTATATAHWDAAARHLGTAPADGIYTGPGALAASLIIGTGYLPPHDPHHALLPRATTWLAARAIALADHHHRRAAHQQATPWAIYDVIKGLTGIGRVLLAAHHRGHHHQAQPGLHAALTALTHLTLTPQGQRPGWWLPAELHPSTVRAPASGAATTGLAHGIAGPLALLATAHPAGHTVAGQVEAVHTAAQWLLTWRSPNLTWPPHISGDALARDEQPAGTPRGRTTAWCYGVPGITTALATAHQALAKPELHQTAHAAMRALAERPAIHWDTEGSALCHGTAGVLQCARRLPCPAVTDRAAPTTVDAPPRRRTPGFLTGRTGTALALADLAGILPAPPDAWDSLLLLS